MTPSPHQPSKSEIAFVQKAVRCPKCREEMRPVTLSGKPAFFCVRCQEAHEELLERSQKAASTPDTSDYLPGLFLEHWTGPTPETEYQFAPGRKSKFDLAWPAKKVAVECEGYVHRTESRFHSDVEKYNTATLLGWKVYRCTSRILKEQPLAFTSMIERELET